MSITDYASLQSTMGSFLNRSDLTSVLPTFVQMAESEFSRDIYLQGSLTQATYLFIAQTVTLPTDLMQLVNLRIDLANYGPLLRVEPHEFDRLQAVAATDTPRYYTVVGTQLSVYPTPPSTGITVHITYTASLAALSNSNTTNWLLLKYPDLYLYGSLKHTAPYLRDDERIALWDALYQKAKEAALIANERAEFGATPLTIRPSRAFGPARTLSGVLS